MYVTPTGSGTGTKTSPASLATAIASSASKWELAYGVYNISTPIQLSDNLTIEGGFDPVTWIKSNGTITTIQKDASNVIPNPAYALVAIVALNKTGFRLQDLKIIVGDAPSPMVSVYGIYLNGCSNYNIVRCDVTTGAGAPGVVGAPGTPGLDGALGSDGMPGAVEPGPCNGGAGGAGGNVGGAGGSVLGNYGNPQGGSVGAGTGGGTAGSAGASVGCSVGCTFGDPSCGSTGPGGNGGNGAQGANGTIGSAGAPGMVSLAGYFVVGTQAGSGTTGAAGGGGGGGGAGGGRQRSGSDDWGGGGGGGGGGGYGGGGGTGGFGGGGSFAIFLFNNGAGGNITDCSLHPGAGGVGGPGGLGVGGGNGADGGNGGAAICGNDHGGNGGKGGNGGRGGDGGKGADGPSVALSENGGTPVTHNALTTVPGNPPVIAVDNAGCTNAQVTFQTPGAAGAWNFGAGANPATGNGTGPLIVTYGSTGRKTITFAGTTFTDFIDIVNNQTLNSITYTPNNPVNGCPVSFTTSLNGSFYEWHFGPSSVVQVVAGSTDQTADAFFTAPGTYTVYVLVTTQCCGIVKDSLQVTIGSSTINVSLTAAPTGGCVGQQIDFTASPSNYISYTFLIDTTIVQNSANNTYSTTALQPGDSVRVLGFNGTCYTNPSATIFPTITPPPAAPNITSSVDTICAGDPVTFTATPGYDSYLFYNTSSLLQTTPSNTFTTTQLGAANDVYVKAYLNGCESPSSNHDTIFVRPIPGFLTIAAQPSNPLCAGDSITVLATVGGLNQPDTYTFYLNGNQVQTGASNTYGNAALITGDEVTAKASLNGCSGSPSLPIDFVVNPKPNTTLTTTAVNNMVCAGVPVTFTATPANWSNYTFYNGATQVQTGANATFTSSTLTTGSSISVVASNLGCTGKPSDTITVTVSPAPVVEAGSNQIACQTDPSVVLTGFSPANGTWTGTGITIPAGTFDPGTAGPGTYVLRYNYTDPNTGCPGVDSITFTVNAKPNLVVNPSSLDLCETQSAQLTASGGINYAWSPATGLDNASIANPVASPTQSTVYTVTTTDNANCSATVNVSVNVSPNPTAAFEANSACAGVPILFGNNSVPTTGLTYRWAFGDGKSSVSDLPTHTYATADTFTVQLIATEGNCSDTATSLLPVFPAVHTVFEANPTVGYNDPTSPISFINRTTGADAYSWDFGDSTHSTLVEPSHIYEQPGVYTVMLIGTNQFGCDDTLTRQNYVAIYQSPKVFVPNVFSPNGDSKNDVLKTFTTGTRYYEWVIFDRIGEKVYQSLNPSEGWDGTFKGKDVPMGVYTYYLKLVFDDGTNRFYNGSITVVR